jgi:tRNA(Ile)-lysidine synthase
MMNLSGFAGKRICAAVSGGADSTAMLHMLKEAAQKDGFVLQAVNCEHGIRGENSLADTRFVQELCAKWEIPLFCFSADCPKEAKEDKVSLETAARAFRYRSFQTLLKEGKTDYIALAHHADDEAETVLFRLCRGASLSGAKGMGFSCGAFLRPLLDMTKTEILSYVREHGLPYREDETNFALDATRNKLRLQVLPLLNEAIPAASASLTRFARLAAEDDELLYALSDELVVRQEDEISVLFSEKKPLFCRACLTAMKEKGIEKDYTSVHLESLFALQKLQTGSKISLLNGVEAVKGYDRIYFSRRAEDKISYEQTDLELPFGFGKFDMGRYLITVSLQPLDEAETSLKTLVIDAERIPDTAVFRFKREGDVFDKFGGGGSKSLKKYLIDKKIPLLERAFLPLLAEREGNTVYAICGVEIADRVKITPATKRRTYMYIHKNIQYNIQYDIQKQETEK